MRRGGRAREALREAEYQVGLPQRRDLQEAAVHGEQRGLRVAQREVEVHEAERAYELARLLLALAERRVVQQLVVARKSARPHATGATEDAVDRVRLREQLAPNDVDVVEAIGAVLDALGLRVRHAQLVKVDVDLARLRLQRLEEAFVKVALRVLGEPARHERRAALAAAELLELALERRIQRATLGRVKDLERQDAQHMCAHEQLVRMAAVALVRVLDRHAQRLQQVAPEARAVLERLDGGVVVRRRLPQALQERQRLGENARVLGEHLVVGEDLEDHLQAARVRRTRRLLLRARRRVERWARI